MLPIRLVARRQLPRAIAARPAVRSLLPQLTARTSSRGYSSAHDEKPGSDLPWAVGAVIATAGGLYWALTPSSHGGGHHDDEHGDDSHGHADSHNKEEEKPAEEAKEEPEEAKEEEKPAEGSKPDVKKVSEDDQGEGKQDRKESQGNPETPSKKA